MSTSPGSPLSPGLPGTHSSASDRARGADRAADRARIPSGRPGQHKGDDKGRKNGGDRSRKPDLPGLPDMPEGKVGAPDALVPDPAPASKVGDGERALQPPSELTDATGTRTDGRTDGAGQARGHGHGAAK
ncbi:MAG TPA: hypothetical protein VNS46_03855 [Nocardioides sp.]|nr:hypothetical protein [Nocardioides sp.]